MYERYKKVIWLCVLYLCFFLVGCAGVLEQIENMDSVIANSTSIHEIATKTVPGEYKAIVAILGMIGTYIFGLFTDKPKRRK